MDPLSAFCPNPDCPARGHTARDNIKIHCRKRRRYRCTVCGKTFSERTGTPFLHAKAPTETIILVMTLIAHGCPLAAIEAGFGFQRRTVRDWLVKAGRHCHDVHEHLVLQPQVLQHVQCDEVYVRQQHPPAAETRGKRDRRRERGRWLYLFSAVCVSTRLWLGGVVSPRRDEYAACELARQVRRAALLGPLLVLCDGFSAYVKAFGFVFREPLHTGQRGRPRMLRWSGLVVMQQVKQRRLVRLAIGTWIQFTRLWRQVGQGTVTTSYIERLNATFRERLSILSRRTRNLVRTQATLDAALYLLGSLYNFCWVHRSLGRTPAQAAGLVQDVWTVEHLLWYRVPPERWRPPRHRGPLSKRERALLAVWGE